MPFALVGCGTGLLGTAQRSLRHPLQVGLHCQFDAIDLGEESHSVMVNLRARQTSIALPDDFIAHKPHAVR